MVDHRKKILKQLFTSILVDNQCPLENFFIRSFVNSEVFILTVDYSTNKK